MPKQEKSLMDNAKGLLILFAGLFASNALNNMVLGKVPIPENMKKFVPLILSAAALYGQSKLTSEVAGKLLQGVSLHQFVTGLQSMLPMYQNMDMAPKFLTSGAAVGYLGNYDESGYDDYEEDAMALDIYTPENEEELMGIGEDSELV